MSNINCVVTTSRQFKETAKKFDVSIGTLRDIVFKYQNSEEGKVGDFPSDEYIKNKISGESMLGATKAQIEVWKVRFSEPYITTTLVEARALEKEALKFFDKKSVNIHKTFDGKYKLSVAKPNENQLLYQQDLISEIQKLKRINTPLAGKGSVKKMKEALKNTGVSPLIYNTIIKAIEESRTLASLTPYDIFQTISKSRYNDMEMEYHKAIEEPILKGLEEHLINFLSAYNIDFIDGSELCKEHGVLGAYDILNKVIHVAKDRNALTLPEEAAHAIIELLGSVPHKNLEKFPETLDFTFLMDNVSNTEIYKRVYEEYKSIYVNERGLPDIKKIKKEAIGQALAVAIKNNWESNEILNSEKSFWEKLKDFFDKIIKVFSHSEYMNFESLVNQIAKEVINNDYSRFKKVESKDYKLLDYAETLANQNNIDGGKAISFMQFYTGLGNIITGSLSYRKQGSVYRGKLDALHDIDMIVPYSAHGIDLNNLYMKQMYRIKNKEDRSLVNHLLDQDYFKKVSAKYPKLKYGNAYNTNGYITLNAVYSENEELSNRFLEYSGSYASRLDKFTEEERSQIYLFDFFLKPEGVNTDFIEDSDNNLRLAKWNVSFKEKQSYMGRAKDIFDYQSWKLFDEYKDNIPSEKEFLMFQKKHKVQENKSNSIKVTLSTEGYRKGDPQKNSDINYVFTENAEAYMVSQDTGAEEDGTVLPSIWLEYLLEFPNKGKTKLNVSDVNGTNQAGIRTDSKGNISPNAYGIVVKKYQQDANGKFVAKEGQFQDTEKDFYLFTSLNNDMFKRLSESSNTKVVFPTQMALGKAALPLRFAEWLQEQLLSRYGITSEIEENTNSKYDGYGLRLTGVTSDKLTKAETKFSTSKTSTYPKRTEENADWSDVTLALAVDFTTAGERLTAQKAGSRDKKYLGSNKTALTTKKDKYIPYELVMGGEHSFDSSEIADSIKSKKLPTKGIKLNIAGNGIYTLESKGWTQEILNDYITDLIKGLQEEGITIAAIRSGGQTGVDEAGIIAAQRLGIPSEVHSPKDYAFRVSEDTFNKVYKGLLSKDEYKQVTKGTYDILNREDLFKARFKTQEVEEVNIDMLNKAAGIVAKIMGDSAINIKKHPNFDKEGVEGSHTYLIKKGDEWVPADISVTQLVHGKMDIGPWGLPSSRIGNSLDRFVREYFSREEDNRRSITRKKFPNLSLQDRRNLRDDLEKLTALFDKKFGKGKYKVVTDEFPIAGEYSVEVDGQIQTAITAGTMDMLIYDDKGNFYIYDMKTVRTKLDENKLSGYYKQLSIYKAILEANYPELKGKIKEMKLIRFDTYYSDPRDVDYFAAKVEEGEDKDLLLVYEDDLDKFITIDQSKEYRAPRLHNNSAEDSLYDVKETSLDGTFDSLDSDEKAFMEDEARRVVEKNITPNESSIVTDALYNNPLLSASERLFLANNVMSYVSFIVTNLQNDVANNSYYLGNKYAAYNFTEMSREDILAIPGLLNSILYYIKEVYYKPINRTDINDLEVLLKLQVAYDNWEALVKSAYSRLITLEGVTVYNVATEDIKNELTEVTDDYDLDASSLEEKEREHWQLGIRQLSAKASLSKDIRRMFEKLEVTDFEGNSVRDKYGFNFKTFVDSGEAVNKILDWVQNATTIEEMETILSEMSVSYAWINPILEKIKEEPFRSQFFQNFRKDFTQYSIVTVSYDKNGNRIYETHTINTKGATVAVLDGVKTAFKEGMLKFLITPIQGDIEGRGSVNINSVRKIKDKVADIIDTLHDNFGTRKLSKTINEVIPDLVKVLNVIGISVDTQVLKAAFANDIKAKNEINTKYNEVLTNISYILNTLEANKNNKEYNPVLKGEEGNVYGNYKKIVNTLSKYIQDNIEASTYENGKMHYSFVTPSYMGKLITNLKNSMSDINNYKEFLHENYGSYKWFKIGKTWNNTWLEDLDTKSEARQVLEHKVQLSFNGTPYTDLSELGYSLSLIHEYFYDNKSKNKNLAWYRVPILANKPSSEFIRFYRHSGTNYKRTIKKGLKKTFNQEIMRIRTVLERSVNPNINKIGVKDKITFDIKDNMLNNSKGKKDNTLIKKLNNLNSNNPKYRLTFDDLVVNGRLRFAGSGAEFKFLSALNNEIVNRTELGQYILDKINGISVEETALTKAFDLAIDNYMDQIVSKEIRNYESMGLFEIEEKEVEDKGGKNKKISRFKYVHQLGDSREAIEDALEEYIWNDMLATINIIQLTATDLAYYRNMEDFQKRYAQVHAPSMRLNVTAVDSKGRLYSSDKMERTIYLKDDIIESEIIPNVEKIFDDKIATLSGVEKTNMRAMKALIVNSFKDVNVADAQGYSSPTSYRKKLGMMGKWTTEMEEAYDRIRSGNFNVNDLGVVWQPLKPFVYSQIRKSSGATTMSELKVPVQNKNSEYLLILADALMRGGNQVNRLSAIFDFMEESAYDGRIHRNGKVITEGVYNGKGIDTVQFESAVNSGSMGAIDISQYQTYEEIKDALFEAVYYNSDKSETSDNDNDRYNDQYVHTIPFEDYGIQQEVPAHFIDHEQLMGSQIRILSISDITEGTIFDVNGEVFGKEDLIEEYQNLIAENIKDSFDKLVKDFKITGTRKEKNKAISEILIDAILKDQRYGADLLRACEINPNTGEFNIPLSDPIHSIRIQQLINSIIKSRINKQKIKGGPVVQVSNFGFADELQIVWDEKDPGKIKYFECYMPVPSEELERAITKYDSEGNAYFMSIEEAIEKGIMTEEMRKAIGYRIPTEDKYSMAPLYIKGFLPKAAGEAVVLPKVITKLSGSDFDIDKLYIMLKSFSYKEAEPNYKLINKVMKEFLREKGEPEEYIRNYVYGNPANKESGVAEYIKKIEDGVSFGRYNEEGDFVEDEKGLEIYDWYMDNKDKITTIPEFKEDDDLDTRDGRNNRIFDLQWAVLTHKDTMIKMFNPGSFDSLEKSALINRILESSDDYTYRELNKMELKDLEKISDNSEIRNIVLPSTQIYYHKQNMTAGKLIGIFANNNTSHAFLSMQNIHLNVDTEFMFNGIKISNSQNNKLDNVVGHDGSLISKVIASCLAAAVDAVKKPVLDDLNINTFTVNTAMLLARLGFDADSISLFTTQPIIKVATREYFRRSNEGYVSIDDIIESLLPEDRTLVEGIEDSLANTEFTKDDLAEGKKDSIDSDFQYSVLVLFQKLANMAQDLNTLTFLTKFNSVTNAVGPTIADTLVMRERYNKFLDKMDSDKAPFSQEAVDVIDNSPILKAFYDTTVSDRGASRLIFEDYFPHYSPTFSSILAELRRVIKGTLDSKTINKLVNAFVLYKLTAGNNPVLDSSYESRKKYIIDFVDTFKSRVSGIIDNDLLKIINIKGRDNKCPVATLEAKTGGYSIDVQEKVKNAWSNLVINPNTRELGTDLFYYNVFRSGFGFSPKSFGHLTPVDVKMSLDRYVDTIADVTFNDREVITSSFLYQFLRNNTNDFKLIPRFTPGKQVKVDTKTNIKKEKTVTFVFDSKKRGMEGIIVSSGEETVYAPVIMYNDKLYMNPVETSSNSIVYTETTMLGNPNNFMEYDGNSGADIKSVLNSKSSSTTTERESSSLEPEGRRKNSIDVKALNSILKTIDKEDAEGVKKLSKTKRILKLEEVTEAILSRLGVDINNTNFIKLVRTRLEERLKELC